jgi:hypothetical protein
MIITNDPATLTIAITTRTNEQEMIAADQTHGIAPTPKRAAHSAQVITTETAHTSTKRKRSTRKQTPNGALQAAPHKKNEAYTQDNVTQ